MSKEIFISHSIKDKVIADAFVDLILHGGLSVPINTIFCVSTEGTKIKSGEDWRIAIKKNIQTAKINFLLISPNYKESEVCMNEMGAAWMTEAEVLPLIIDPITYKTVGVIQEPIQIEKLLDENSLDRIRDLVQERIGIAPALIKSDRWTQKKREFLLKVKKHIEKNPFEIPMDKATFKKMIQENSELETTIDGLMIEKEELENLVEELKKTKDKTEVKAIVKKRKRTSQFDDFLELCSVVKAKLKYEDPVINGIIFKSYTGKEITIGFDANRKAIDEAIANDYIDDELEVRWDRTKEMREIEIALKDVDAFLRTTLDNKFSESYEDQFDAPMSMSNKKFWQQVLGVSISFD